MVRLEEGYHGIYDEAGSGNTRERSAEARRGYQSGRAVDGAGVDVRAAEQVDRHDEEEAGRGISRVREGPTAGTGWANSGKSGRACAWRRTIRLDMLVYVRHGATSLNKGGTEERLRGWLPVPLAPKGIEQAKATGLRLAQNIPTPDSARESDLNRTMQTGDIIGNALGIKVEPDPRVRDWNTGKLAGQKVMDVLPELQRLIKNPDEPAPGGESVNDYRQRFEPLMRDLVTAPGVHLVIGHARGATLLQGIADPEGGKGGDVPIRFLLNRPTVEPGGILIVNKNWDTTVDNPSAGGAPEDKVE